MSTGDAADAADAKEADFVEFVRARQQALLRFAYLLTSDHHTAEDLVQTALAKTYLSWDKLRERGALDAYVRRIIINENTSLWRRAWKRNERPSEYLPEPAGGHHDRAPEGQSTLWRVVRNLPERQRATVVLRYYEDLSEAETAAVLGCSVGTVKSQTSRAIAALRATAVADPGLLGGDQ
ncbi:MAG: SigE family RNA polymerase sigma factor [Nocardioidaceae bacterium]